MARKKNTVEETGETEVTLEQEIAQVIERTVKVAGDVPIITSRKREGQDPDGSTDGDRTARRPDISWLEDAVTVNSDGSVYLHFDVGARIVIERYALTIPGNPWLDTQTYVVQSIDPASGVLQLWNPDLYQSALTNFKLGLQHGFKFKLAPTRGASIGKKRRGRPRTKPEAPKVEKPEGEKKKGRGRPKGIKNRPKEVIVEEKKAKAAEASAKRARRARKG